MVYKFKQGSHIKADANIAGRMCEQLEQTKDGLTAKTLLDANRPADAPLHSCFEWNDGIAAEAYREQQARHIINCLCVVSETDTKAEPVRAFFTISEKKYENIQAIVTSTDKHAALLEIALRELQAFKRKYETLSELRPILIAIDEMEQTV